MLMALLLMLTVIPMVLLTVIPMVMLTVIPTTTLLLVRQFVAMVSQSAGMMDDQLVGQIVGQ